MRCLYFADDWNSLLAPGNPQRHANSATRRYSILRNIVGIPPSVYAIPGSVQKNPWPLLCRAPYFHPTIPINQKGYRDSFRARFFLF